MEASDRLGSSRADRSSRRGSTPNGSTRQGLLPQPQKLTGKTFITHSNERTYTLWETIANTINDPERTLYLVLDEAHRGMRAGERQQGGRGDRLDHSAAPHQRPQRTPPRRSSGGSRRRSSDSRSDEGREGPNDAAERRRGQRGSAGVGPAQGHITLDLPDETGAFDTVLAREAAKACQEASQLWEAYASRRA